MIRSNLLARIYELPGGSARLRPMEGLRGLAVLMVFFVHFYALFGGYARHVPVLWYPCQFLGLVGNGGVDLFFVLSGYLIYGALIRHGSGLFRFLRRRAQRIYPTFLAVFTLYVALSFIFPHVSKLRGLSALRGVGYLLQNLLLLPGVFNIVPLITVAWSLSYEFFFYIAAALLIRATRTWTWPPYLRVAAFSTLWCGYLTACFFMPRSHVRVLMFVVGILMYEALSSTWFRRKLSWQGETLAAALFIAGITITYLFDIRSDIVSMLPNWWAGRNPAPGIPAYQGPYKTMVLSVTMFWFILYSFAFDGWLSRLFSWTPLRYLGNISYSYYLIHGVTLQGLALVWPHVAPDGGWSIKATLMALPLGFAATWISSTLLFLMVEKPFSLEPKATAAPLTAHEEKTVHA